LRTPIERTEQEARIALFFSFFKSTKDKLFQFEVGGLKEHLTVFSSRAVAGATCPKY
jgi:hypothetical protein